MAEFLVGLLGLLMIASWVYMMVAQFKSIYKDRSVFEKIVTWFSIVTLILYFIGTISTQISG
ncbi:MAG: hypothetical protein KGQ16_14775 [Cyanobacteria bacterium REEB444]|nr:hypothetical protein [Cyanobacteria bacterium REEB444]